MPQPMPEASGWSARGQAEDSRETSQLGLTGGIVAQFDRRRDAEGWQEQLDTSRNLLTVALDEVGGATEVSLSPCRPTAQRVRPNHMSFLPAGTCAWESCSRISLYRRAVLAFDTETVSQIIGQPLSEPTEANVMFRDPRIWHCADLLARMSDGTDPRSQLYCDSLATALFVALFSPREPSTSGGLLPWQLRRVTDFIMDHLAEDIPLADLSALLGQSQSHFGREFRIATGMPPHKWQMNARVRRAQELMLDRHGSLADIAMEVGFADQSHFTRVFRAHTGLPPGQWKRAHVN